MIKEKLRTWKYYYDKLPLFFKNSYGLSEHFKILFNVLVELDYSADDILKGFDVFAEDYNDYILRNQEIIENRTYYSVGANLKGKTIYLNNNLNPKEISVYFSDDTYGAITWGTTSFGEPGLVLYDKEATTVLANFYTDGRGWLSDDDVVSYTFEDEAIVSTTTHDNILYTFTLEYKLDILEKIAEIYGITRFFDVKYTENNALVKKSLYLDNFELHKLLLTRIVQANYDGTYADARELYDKIGLPIYMINDTQSATVSLYLDNTKVNNSNIVDMFKANLFTLKSLGINYLTSVQNISALGVFDDENRVFDKGLWS